MKELEDIFRDHKNEFEEEIQADHFNNFLDKMNSQEKRSFFERTPTVLKVAVIITFVLFSGLIGYQVKNMENKHLSLGQVSPEYKEVELYYTSNINNQLVMLQQMGSFNKEQDQVILNQELKEMDERYSQLKEELDLHPDDERVIQAMIEYYQVKTNVLNQIIEQLYQLRKDKITALNTSV